MSVTLMSSVFRCNVPEMKTDDGKVVPDTTAKFVLLALADNANDEGEGAYPGVDTLCKKTNFSTSTVCNALNALRHNGFTTLEGRSKRDTNNYTISVARILEFQWPKREDSSHRNASVSTAETNPSSIHPLTINTSVSAEIFRQANAKVDAILENEKTRGPRYTNRDKIPEPLLIYADTYYELTGQEPTKRVLMDWLGSFSDWQEEGITAAHVRAAYQQAEGKFPVLRPGSLTNTAAALAAKGKVKEQQQDLSYDPLAPLFRYQESLNAAANS